MTPAARPADHAHYFGSKSSQADYRTIVGVLAASDDDVARIYARIGFRRVGTAMIAEPDAT